MHIVHQDNVIRIEPGTQPDYLTRNPVNRILALMQDVAFAAEREHYFPESLQYLFPIRNYQLYGPQDNDADILDPALQDNKLDFQKQNVAEFTCTDTFIVRGYVTVGDWSGPFIKISYRGGPDSFLSKASRHTLGNHIRVWLRIGGKNSQTTLVAPYVDASDRYELEIWGYPGDDLHALLDVKGQTSLQRGELICRPDLVHGHMNDFLRKDLDDKLISEKHPDHAMHPVRPLHIELAWCKHDESIWDSLDSRNYHYEFNMRYRGWNNFLRIGMSEQPHGGEGFLHYRNLFSNYYKLNSLHPAELGRDIHPWNFNAYGNKNRFMTHEAFFAVDYMDLHILRPHCAIGLHRHRDNQEAFMLMSGKAFMIVGDWCQMPERERCLEIRHMTPGHLAMLRGGQLHALVNATDEDANLFVFGGYD